MAVIGDIVGCCGCGRGRETDGRPQNHQNAVVDRQPQPIEPPMAVRVYKSIKRFATPRRYPRPTMQQLEELYLEGKELARLEAEHAEKQKQSLTTTTTQQQGFDETSEPVDINKGLEPPTELAPAHTTTEREASKPTPIKELEPKELAPPLLASEVEDDDDDLVLELSELAPPPLIHTIDLNHDVQPELPELIIRQVRPHFTADTDDKNILPALRYYSKEITTVSDADSDEIAAILANPYIACEPPYTPLTGTQTAKKMAAFFQDSDDDNRSSVYPSDEESMHIPPPSQPLSRILTPINIVEVNKYRKTSRHITPGNLIIRPIFEVLEQARTPLAEKPAPVNEQSEPPRKSDGDESKSVACSPVLAPTREEVDIRSLPHPDEFELEELPPPALPVDEVGIRSLPDPDDFPDSIGELVDVPITPYGSPKIKPKEQSAYFKGMHFLKLEYERVKRYVEEANFSISPWEKPAEQPAPAVTKLSTTGEDVDSTDTIAQWAHLAKVVENLQRPEQAVTRGPYGIDSLSHLSSLSLASNLSLQALRSFNSGTLTPSDRNPYSVLRAGETILTGLPPPYPVYPPAPTEVTESTGQTIAETVRKGTETIAKSITNGFSSLFRRFGAPTVELQSSEPQPTVTTAIPSERVNNRSVHSFAEATLPLSPTPSTLTLMRTVMGLKVEGTLRVATVADASPELAREAMSSGLLTVDYTDSLNQEYLNQFDGHNWEAPDGKIPWYCDANGAHVEERLLAGLRHAPGQRLRDATNAWDVENEKVVVLPTPSTTSTSTGGPTSVRTRQLIPTPVAQQEAPTSVPYVVVASPAASSAALQAPGVRLGSPVLQAVDSLVAVGSSALIDPLPRLLSPTESLDSSSASPQTRLGSPIGPCSRGIRIVSGASVSSDPRYDPQPHRFARMSTCGLDLSVDRAFYMSYEDRLKLAVKSWMRGRPSIQRLSEFL
ncbi:hypothetical protein H072_3716 [Dactylellina haptotyla CBS 200.50]|uniref:Uncharacterized protein n=1 Tax=Dactylellina haptotyla (strain CBS 200.50) TaxID=1284197 RepID=S8AH44_DACHA|nr:hypothetical protein H072_3716 [Dactylellina haptotyla CBS 200.50]